MYKVPFLNTQEHLELAIKQMDGDNASISCTLHFKGSKRTDIKKKKRQSLKQRWTLNLSSFELERHKGEDKELTLLFHRGPKLEI